MTAALQSALQQNLPALQHRLDELVSARRADVETMRERTTPWRRLETEDGDDAQREEESRIPRVDPNKGSDDLSRIEAWATEVVRTLTSSRLTVGKLPHIRDRQAEG
jgi:hypothetical protein